ncbi:MAG TPA: T9SS type A sorting domain-containing protein [Hanamia sp.]|nr:T9SS type A sorting domain-containing protein [Hanamia sp.]
MSNGVYTITASGKDIWNTADGFHYLFQRVITNQTELTARIVSIDNTDPGARCGVMFRQNLDPGSPYVFLNLIPGQRIYLQERLAQNTSATRSGTSIVQLAPYWVRIFNDGNKYISYVSANGDDWTAIDSVTLAMGPNSYVGIAYTSRNNSVLGTAVVDNVTLTMGGALQVNLLNFNGKNVNEKQALLNWTTTGESQNDHFEIERSTKNTDFKTIGIVRGNGTTSKTNSYTFTDNSPWNGVNFYRLKQVDINGKCTYSPIITVNFNLRKLGIFPNPARDKIYIHNNEKFSYGENVKIQMMDFSGKVVYQQIFKTKGVNIITLKVPQRIANGMYILTVINSQEEKQGDNIFINR